MYRKFSADHIFNGYELLPANNVLITDAEGIILDIVDKNTAGDDIKHFSGILSPGLINCHCHIELSHMKGVIEDGTGLVMFVEQVMTQRNAPQELKLQYIADAEKEMYNNGIVAVGDICNTTDSIAIKRNSLLKWHNFIEVSGFVDAVADKRLEAVKAIEKAFKNELPHQITTLSPHAPYSVSKRLFELLNIETAYQLISIHNQESKEEDKLYLNKSGDFLHLYKDFGIDISSFIPTGKSSLQSYLPYFNKSQSILFVHNTFSNKEDLDFLQRSTTTKQFLILCPNANLYIENEMPAIEYLSRYKDIIAIGTDSCASNYQLDILEEIKALQKYYPLLSLVELLKWVTSNGAAALQMDALLGSFEKNKKPGIVLIENVENMKLSVISSSKRIL